MQGDPRPAAARSQGSAPGSSSSPPAWAGRLAQPVEQGALLAAPWVWHQDWNRKTVWGPRLGIQAPASCPQFWTHLSGFGSG